LRDAAKRAGVSHTYLSILEKGHDLRSGNPVTPTHETLKLLSKAYNYPYEELLRLSGVIDQDMKNSLVGGEDLSPLQQDLIRIIKTVDDPDTLKTLIDLSKKLNK
jgi:transcriptional regulator with XRE-family HTH domain